MAKPEACCSSVAVPCQRQQQHNKACIGAMRRMACIGAMRRMAMLARLFVVECRMGGD